MRSRYLLGSLLLMGSSMLMAAERKPWVYQTGPINALLQGLFQGTVRCQSLLKEGDIGLGTFDALDGEMIVLDGRIYQARQDGSVEQPKDCTTPFAAVSRLGSRADSWQIDALTREQLEQELTKRSANLNGIDVIRIEGDFEALAVRVAPRQKPPYPKLSEAVKQQPVFSYENIKVTLLGFRFPTYTKLLNVSGFHLHFVSDERKRAGHAFEFRLKSAKVKMANAQGLKMAFPEDQGFAQAALTPHSEAEMKEVESRPLAK